MGSFETDLNVPDQRKQPIKLSSVLLASQRTPVPPAAARRGGFGGPGGPGGFGPGGPGGPPNAFTNPLIQDGNQLVPNVPHVLP